MARFTLITDAQQIAVITARSKGAARNKALASRMVEYDEMILDMDFDNAVEIEPEGDETTRQISMRVAQAKRRAKEAGKLEGIDITAIISGGNVYVTKTRNDIADKPARKSRKAVATPEAVEA